MAEVTLGLNEEAAPAEKSFEERVADKLRDDFKQAVIDLVGVIERSKNLLWLKNPDDAAKGIREEAQVQAILGHLGALGPVLFDHHKSAREWIESRGLATFSEEEKITPYLTKLAEDGSLTTDGPRVVVPDEEEG